MNVSELLLNEGTSIYEYTLILYVLNGKLFITYSASVVDNTFLLPVCTMTYPLACDDILQLTLKLVSFNIYALTLSGPLPRNVEVCTSPYSSTVDKITPYTLGYL